MTPCPCCLWIWYKRSRLMNAKRCHTHSPLLTVVFTYPWNTNIDITIPITRPHISNQMMHWIINMQSLLNQTSKTFPNGCDQYIMVWSNKSTGDINAVCFWCVFTACVNILVTHCWYGNMLHKWNQTSYFILYFTWFVLFGPDTKPRKCWELLCYDCVHVSWYYIVNL